MAGSQILNQLEKISPIYLAETDTEKYLTVLPHNNWPRPSDQALLLHNFSEDIFIISSQIQSSLLIESVTMFEFNKKARQN